MSVTRAALGTTGAEVTRVGLGSWAFGGAGWSGSWGPQDDADSIRAIRHAVERGVKWLDTAAVYGLGHSEEVVRRALAELSEAERPYVFTKCGLVWTARSSEPRCVLAPESIRRECEDSLRRLGVERIDLYQCHWPSEDGTPVEESWATMAALVDEGKVRWIGVSNFDTDMLDACEPIRHVDTLQPPFSLLDRRAGADLLPWCEAHGTGVIVYSPLASGLLTGGFSVERAASLDAEDWRRQYEEFQEPKLGRNLQLVERLRPIAERRNCSLAELAIAWTLAWPGVSGAIVGARRAEQVDGWIRAAAVRLGTEDLDEAAAAIEETGVGKGPLRPPRA